MNLFGILPCNAFCHIYFFDGGGVECICRGTSPCVSTVGGTYVGVCGGCGLGILTYGQENETSIMCECGK